MNQLRVVKAPELPQSYEHAKRSLAKCVKIDECKQWSDKAAALASYAVQADDESLLKYARRIQDRANRRAGELLAAIPSGQGHNKKGAPAAHSRKQAAEDAGMSERQRKTAQRIATIPKDKFDELVDSDQPPTPAQLATLGTKTKPPTAKAMQTSLSVTKLRGIIRAVDKARKEYEPADFTGLISTYPELPAECMAAVKYLEEIRKCMCETT